MAFTVTEARGNRRAAMHCIRGHKFTLATANNDDYGSWCPECGGTAHSDVRKGCTFCEEHDASPDECHEHCTHGARS
jgi:hypothetical protein